MLESLEWNGRETDAERTRNGRGTDEAATGDCFSTDIGLKLIPSDSKHRFEDAHAHARAHNLKNVYI